MLELKYVISLFAISSGCAMRKLPIFHDIQLNKMLDIDWSSINKTPLNNVDVYNTSLTANETKIPYETFIPFLLNTSMWLLQNARKNIIKNYDLSAEDIKDIEIAFEANKYQYQIILKNNVENMMKNIKYSSPEIFLLDLTDFSNYLLQTIIQNNLNNVKGKLLVPSKWNKNMLKYIIVRQQTKIVINVIEVTICHKFSICVPKSEYSEYTVEWLRHLLNVENTKLNEFIHLISQVLDKHSHTIKTNKKFRQKSKDLIKADFAYKRNLIDFIDEVITEQDIMKVVPRKLKKYAVLLKDFFVLIDENYDLNVENEKEMDDLNTKFFLWAKGENIEIMKVLEEIVENMSRNVQIWQKYALSELENIWFKIVVI